MNIGDKVVCVLSGVCGVIVKIYTPTASAPQIMVRTGDGRLYLSLIHISEPTRP